MNDEDLQNAIRAALMVKQPCWAGGISSYIRDEYGYDISPLRISRELRFSLSSEIQRDSLGWTLSEKEQRTEVSDHLNLVGLRQPAVNDQVIRLRTIMRLRSGLPPTESLNHLSVGYQSAMVKINNLFEGGRWIMALGDYGAGKTHFLQYLRSLSHARGFATCFLSSDSGMSALNHPQRFMTSLLHTLEIPEMLPGYENLIYRLAVNNDGCRKIVKAVERNAEEMSSRMPFNNALGHLADLEIFRRVDCDASSYSHSHAELLRFLMESLTGQTISNRQGSLKNREVAYRLLLTARDVIMSIGCRGLVILIDEAESIFTKLPNYIARMGAIRVLSSLCYSKKLKNILTAVAMTPDGLDALKGEVSGYQNSERRIGSSRYSTSDCVRDFEPLDAFRLKILNGDHLLVNCGQINNIPKLLEQIQSMYARAYSADMVNNNDWSRFVNISRSSNLPARLIVRQAVDLLDTIRFDSTC